MLFFPRPDAYTSISVSLSLSLPLSLSLSLSLSPSLLCLCVYVFVFVFCYPLRAQSISNKADGAHWGPRALGTPLLLTRKKCRGNEALTNFEGDFVL